MKTTFVDFHQVAPHQREIDRRLANWALWCNGTYAPITSPMFRMTPSAPQARQVAYMSSTSVDRQDAVKIAKAVAALPLNHRTAVNWHYVKPVNPMRACRAIGCSREQLFALVTDGRQMLINRGV